MQIAGAGGMRAQEIQRELAEIFRADQSLDDREPERECLDESFAQIVAIDVEALGGCDAVRT